jgi:IS5 family transposase
MTDDFFRNRLDQMIDLRHPLAVLANRMPWQEIESSLAKRWARQVKTGKKIEDLDLLRADGKVDFRAMQTQLLNDYP